MEFLKAWFAPIGGLTVVFLYALYVVISKPKKPPPPKPTVINCPDCGGKVSTKVKACPHCGSPMK